MNKMVQIRNLNDSDKAHLSSLQNRFCIATNSKAALHAIRGYMTLFTENIKLKEELSEAQNLIRDYETTISNIRALLPK